MKLFSNIKFVVFFLAASLIQSVSSAQQVNSLADGVIVYPVAKSSQAKVVRLQVINDKIIRVTATPADTFSTAESLVVLPQNIKPGFSIASTDSSAIISTSSLIAIINKFTGSVKFTDKNGNTIVQEHAANGRAFANTIYDGEPFYKIRQTFETANDDAIYGLGQHQDGKINWRNQQVYLFQNNTEVAVPFLISNKNYGILWDNYSISKVGDVRDFLPLDRLKLFDKDGNEGWLTASYFNDAANTSRPDFTKSESHIDYEFLGDTKRDLPKEFDIAKGMIRWQGEISGSYTGEYKFRFTYGGYCKAWINGNLLFDGWRQAWNPDLEVVNIHLEKDKKYSLKIEWIPDGGESYISAKWLPPVDEKDRNSYTFSSEAGKQFDYYFVYGKNMDSVIAGYRKLTGKATIVPKWAMGFWQSRERYKTEDEILSTIKTFRERQIPIDNIVLDWSYWKQDQWGSQEFDPTRFPSPDSMINALHKNYHTHFMISVWPKFYEGIANYNLFDKNGWLYKRNIANRQRDWIGEGYVSTFYDAFNADARKGFWDLLKKNQYAKGVDAWWMDASEPDILSNVNAQSRKEEMTPTALGPAAGVLNAYPLYNAKGIYEGQRATDNNKRVFILTRSGFAGSQHYGAAIWSGDIASRWENMKDQVAAGVNFSMSGIPFWTMDIGGFAVEHRYENATGATLEEWRELNTRWYQFGAFCPLFRVHGQFPYREIFNIAPENHPAYQSMLYYDKLRYRLMPYIYSLAGWTYHKDYTIMRGLAMDFPHDSIADNLDDEYMFGPSLLINPVYTYKAVTRNVYLPKGNGWYDLYSGKFHNGGETIVAPAPYERIPVYVKEGSIIATGPALQYTSEKPADIITLFVYTGRDASFDLYEDGDTTYDYENGAFSIIPIQYNESTKTLTIGNRSGSFQGMLQKRKFNIVWINKDKPVAFDFSLKPDATIRYNGNAISIKMR